jgi:class 3 adenylate cyclase/CHASE2 domain-containing sensor protein
MSNKATVKEKKLNVIICIFVVAFLSVLIVRTIPILRVAENILYDLRISYLSLPQEQSSDIVIVGITEETLSTFAYRSPIDRRFVNDLLLYLDKSDVKVIGLDILFDQATEPDKDSALQATLTSLKTPLIVATAGIEDRLLRSQADYLNAYLDGVEQGSAAVIKDTVDGVIRFIPIRKPFNGPGRLGFVSQIAKSLGLELFVGNSIPIDFKHGPDSETPFIPVYPAHAVTLLPKEWLAGKIVLIGFELEFEDRHPTPLTRGRVAIAELSGVEIHAQALMQLLDKREIFTTGVAWNLAIALTFSCFGIALLLMQVSLRKQLLLVVALLSTIWVGGAFIFIYANTMIKLLPPTLALTLSSLISIIYQWRAEKAKRQFIHLAFSKYMSRSYVDQLVANPDQLKVSGEHREVTFLFTDLAGFTPLTEKLDPESLVSLINEYLEKTCEIVTRHGGMVACIVGDALHVLFNAPVYQDDHAQRAVEAAIELDAFCQNFAALKRSQGIQLDVTRIGINTGVTVVGNFGGKERIEYTAMGDAINTAARLESVNKHLGTRVCVSESTVMQCSGVTFRPIGCLLLKGKLESVNVFEPQSMSSSQTADYAEYLHAYRQMEKQESRALEAFRNLFALYNDDPLVSFHLNRLERGDSGTTIEMKEK